MGRSRFDERWVRREGKTYAASNVLYISTMPVKAEFVSAKGELSLLLDIEQGTKFKSKQKEKC
jgi:hypothetical protein